MCGYCSDLKFDVCLSVQHRVALKDMDLFKDTIFMIWALRNLSKT